MIIAGMSNADYHAHESISKSGLDLIARSPAHFRFQEKREPSRAMVIGSALHAAVLEPEVFASQYMLLRNVSARRASEYKQAVAVHGADFVLTGTEADYVAGMQETIRSHAYAGRVLSEPGRAELSVMTKDPVTGVAVRCRFDWLTSAGLAVDLKTTIDARPDAFARSVANYRYHVQAAFYADVWNWETGETLQGFEFLAVEKSMPHALAVYRLDAEALSEGRRLYREALNMYADCLERDEWPGYDAQPQWLCLPAWAVEFNEEDEGIV